MRLAFRTHVQNDAFASRPGLSERVLKQAGQVVVKYLQGSPLAVARQQFFSIHDAWPYQDVVSGLQRAPEPRNSFMQRTGTVLCKIIGRLDRGRQVQMSGLRGKEQFYAKFRNSFMQTSIEVIWCEFVPSIVGRNRTELLRKSAQ